MTTSPLHRALPHFLTARGRLIAAVALGVGFYAITVPPDFPGAAREIGAAADSKRAVSANRSSVIER
jgi:hypothetical protein